jgi:hypothetical protein
MRRIVIAGLVSLYLMVAASCTSGSTTSPSLSPSSPAVQKHLASELAALVAGLPATATVSGAPDHGQWGNVVVVNDAPENMSPESGATFNALEMWLSSSDNRDELLGRGWNYVLSCSSAVNVGQSGSYVAGSEMIPLSSNAPGETVTVKTGQPTDTANNTTIQCAS